MLIFLIMFCSALFLNGATDAVNSVCGAISAKVLPARRALSLAALCECAGCVISCTLFPSVSETVSSLSALSSGRDIMSGETMCAICLGTVALWAGIAWIFALPTSESHGLMAAICGCGTALGIRADSGAVLSVAAGLVLSVSAGALFSRAAVRITEKKQPKRSLSKKLCVIFLMLSALMHGAQDGQKFIALLFCTGEAERTVLPTLTCAVLMSAGTLLGGTRIVKKMGEDMTHTNLRSSLCADAGSGTALLILTAAGLPVSTTHVKMSALAAASPDGGRSIDKKILFSLAAAWLTTFPFCWILAFLLTKIILSI